MIQYDMVMMGKNWVLMKAYTMVFSLEAREVLEEMRSFMNLEI